MVLRSTVSWNSVIRRYVGKGRFFEATDLFRRMKEERTKPSELVTMVSLLNACACLGALGQGEWIHDYIGKNNFALNAIIVTAIIDGAPSVEALIRLSKCSRAPTRKHCYVGTPYF
jgi:pentatricopeptide repeat protein